MSLKLLIVESPTKARTFQKYLGKGYVIKASKGHVVDLPKSKLGIDIENDFAPQYVTIRGKGKVIKELEQAARKADEVLLATDPDREGEAIAWHLKQHLERRQPNIHRILLNEITKEAIAEAVKHPGEVDLRKVEAQQARRVLDRLVGYQISPLLWKIFYYGLSAGRVQSVALRLIVEREEERRAFVREEYWSLRGEFTGAAGEPFEGKLVKWQGEEPKLADAATARALLTALGVAPATLKAAADEALGTGSQLLPVGKAPAYRVVAVERKQRRRSPEPPYITSTLQRDASSKLGFTARRTMMLAQQLYEGLDLGAEGAVGLITYMRTDSTRIAESARAEHREYVLAQYGADYLPPQARQFKVKAGAQDAHEAIRPTGVARTPESLKSFLGKDQLAVYRLIWQRFMASLMADARYEATGVDVAAGDALFRATGNRLLFDGYRRALGPARGAKTEDAANGDGERLLPAIEEGETLKAALAPRQHFTEPPPRYSESSLIKELEERGIGRPSTYASIVGTIQGRDYLVLDDSRRFQPTELGESVWKVLAEGFPKLFEVGFTARMEAELDKVEEGEEPWTEVVGHLYTPMRKALDAVEKHTDHLREAIREETGEACEKCGRPMIKTWGRNGRFMACSGYPECRNSRPLEAPTAAGTQVCPECGAQMMVRVGRFGRFAACSRYPDCKGTSPLEIGVGCPKEGCGGQLVEKRSKRGRTFYGCRRYPDCDFASWSKPVPAPCPDCGGLVVEKASKAKGSFQQCTLCKLEIPE